MRRVWTLARRLRKAATAAERCLWSRLRGRRVGGLRFRWRHPIAGFAVDFACLAARLVVEIDDDAQAGLAEHAAVRLQMLELSGYRVIRFRGEDVLRYTDAVVVEILRQARLPLPPLLQLPEAVARVPAPPQRIAADSA